MAYLDDETSVHDGEPVELYQFSGPNGVEYLYTSWHAEVTYNTKVYAPVPITREDARGGPQGESPELKVKMPRDLTLVTTYAFDIAPTDLELTLHRLHGAAGPGIVYWKGPVVSFLVKGRVATLVVPSAFGNALESEVPSLYWQGPCNHVLYDPRCSLLRSSYKQDALVNSVLDDVTIQVSTVGGASDDHFRAGEIVVPSEGYRRLILRQVGNILTINYPFRAIAPNDSVELYVGCDHLVTTCKTKFNNVVNFGGHPLVPLRNIFETGV